MSSESAYSRHIFDARDQGAFDLEPRELMCLTVLPLYQLKVSLHGRQEEMERAVLAWGVRNVQRKIRASSD